MDFKKKVEKDEKNAGQFKGLLLVEKFVIGGSIYLFPTVVFPIVPTPHIEIACTGHALRHIPQPIHFSLSIT